MVVRTFPILALAATLATSGCVQTPDERPNVMLISIDSLRADHVGALGYERDTTPLIDRIASKGVTFENAISSTSWTLPAHAALLTGLPDSAHRVTSPSSRLADSAFTLAEAFSASDYRTVGFFSGPFLDPAFGFAQGFDRYVDCTSYGGTDSSEVKRRRFHQASHHDRTNPAILWNVLFELSRVENEPFFFFIHMWDVHYELIPPPPFDTMFDADYPGAFDGRDFRHNPGFRPGMDPADYAHVIALYDGEIRYTDETIRRIVEGARARGLLDNTLVVITADHGDEFLDHGNKGHRHTLYQELIHVPLILSWPGHLPTKRISEVVRLIDVAPTILDLAGLRLPPTMWGTSLVPLIEGRDDFPSLPAMSELVGRRGATLRSLVLGTDKVIVDIAGKKTFFFDLARDPGEKSPLPYRDDERARELLKVLSRQTQQATQARVGSESRAVPSAAVRSRLRALGYLD